MIIPPTIHDSDRKAAEGISEFMWSGYRANPVLIERFALIIARHHAEERAAVEKVRKVFESLLNELDGEAFATTGTANAGILFEHAADARAALTALRTASQSPTEEKT